MTNYTSIANLFFEIGEMKRIQRSGWLHAGIKNPETLAEHVMRTTLIGFVLADLEGANPEKVAAMLIVHDIAEVRIGDQNKVSARYWNNKEPEETAYNEQLLGLPGQLVDRMKMYRNEFENRNTKEGIVAKDADWLEMAITAREYITQGYPACQNWIDNVKKALETESAKQLIAEIEQGNPWDWWKDLKKMTYTKLSS